MEENKTYIQKLTKEQIFELENKVKTTLAIPPTVKGKIERYNDHIDISYNNGLILITFYEYMCMSNFMGYIGNKSAGAVIYDLYIDFMKSKFEDYEIDSKSNALTF